MQIYLDEYGNRIEDPDYTPPPGSFVYGTRRGNFVFPPAGKILTVTAEDPDPSAGHRQMTGK